MTVEHNFTCRDATEVDRDVAPACGKIHETGALDEVVGCFPAARAAHKAIGLRTTTVVRVYPRTDDNVTQADIGP